MEPTTVVIGLGENAKAFEIKPLVAARYKVLFQMIGEIINELVAAEKRGEGGLDLDNLTGSIPSLIDVLGDRRIKVYAYCLLPDEKLYNFELKRPRPKEEVDDALAEMAEWLNWHLTMSQETELLAAIVETNDLEGIVKNFKRMAARAKTEAQIEAKLTGLAQRSRSKTSS
jgi:hypothetical protein